MRIKKSAGWISVCAVIGAIVVIAAAPTSGASKNVADHQDNKTAKLLSSEKAAYFGKVSEADDAFLGGRLTDALVGFRASKAMRTSVVDSTVDCKIGSCYAALGKYADAIAAFKTAKSTDPVGSTTGLIDAEIALLAYKAGDRGTLHDAVNDAQSIQGQGENPTGGALVSGPGTSANAQAKAYLLFARAFVSVYKREGVDFAYRQALQFGGGEPTISKEYAFFLRSRFHDPAGLSRANKPHDPHLAKDMERELASARATLKVRAQNHQIARSSPSSGVDELRKAAFRTQGVY